MESDRMLKRLRMARTRLYFAAFAGLLAWVLGALAVAAVVFILAVRLGSFTLSWPVAGLALICALAIAALVAWRLTPDLSGTARALEQHYGLNERVSTSLELGDRQDGLAEALRADAEQHVNGLRLAGFGKARVSRVQALSLAAGAVLVAVALLVPIQRPGARPLTTGVLREADATLSATQQDFVRQVLSHAQVAAPTTSAAQDVRTNKGPGTVRQPTEGGSQASAPASLVGPAAGLVSDTQPTTVERALDEVSEAVRSAPAGSSQAPPAAPSESSAPLTVRNDSPTNPSANQPSARDQELRDYGRRREMASNPGGGSGDPVAMIDAAVAGDATAGFEGAAGSVLPAGPGSSLELNVPNVTDASGRRVRLERLPDDPDTTGIGAAPTWVEFVGAAEPIVSRPGAPAAADLELLRRYRSGPEASGE